LFWTAIATAACAPIAYGQSDTVFLSIEIGSSSRLIRFDAGLESISIGTFRNAFESVAVFNGELLVGDFFQQTIQRFAPNGNYLGPFATPANQPDFLETDSHGNVYSTTGGFEFTGIATATRFNSVGAATQSYLASGSGFSGIDADAAGNVYVAQGLYGLTTGSLYKYAPNGELLTVIPLEFSPDDISIDEAGNRLFISDPLSAGQGIKIYDISGPSPAFIASIATPTSAYILGLHYEPESGNILAVDGGFFSHDPRGLEFSPTGTLLREYRPSAATSTTVIADDIVSFVPEPSCFALFAIGMLVGVLNLRTRR
jgi:hypothetical protein